MWHNRHTTLRHSANFLPLQEAAVDGEDEQGEDQEETDQVFRGDAELRGGHMRSLANRIGQIHFFVYRRFAHLYCKVHGQLSAII